MLTTLLNNHSLSIHLHLSKVSSVHTLCTLLGLCPMYNSNGQSVPERICKPSALFCSFVYFYHDFNNKWWWSGLKCIPCPSWLPLLSADGIKWLISPSFLFTCSDLFSVVKDPCLLFPPEWAPHIFILFPALIIDKYLKSWTCLLTASWHIPLPKVLNR